MFDMVRRERSCLTMLLPKMEAVAYDDGAVEYERNLGRKKASPLIPIMTTTLSRSRGRLKYINIIISNTIT